MEKKTYFETSGGIAETFVQKKLWTYGFKAINCSNVMRYDLLVDEKYRVEVKYSKLYKGRDNGYYWNIRGVLCSDYEEADILAVVLEMPIKNRVFFLKLTEERKRMFFHKDFILKLRELEKIGFESNPRNVFVGKNKKINLEEEKKLILKKDAWYSLTEASILLGISFYIAKGLVKAKVLQCRVSGEEDRSQRYRIKGEWIIEYMAQRDDLKKDYKLDKKI